MPSCSSEFRFYSKPKKVRIYSCSEFHIHRHGISDTAEFNQGTSGMSRESNVDYQICSLLQSSIGTNFPFSFGQTQCSSRFCSPRQTSFANVSSVCLETSYSSSRSSDYNQQYDRFHLKWWMDTKRFILGIHLPDPNVFLFTDASHLGWGAHLEPLRLSFHGCWTEDQSQLHINMLEMMAIRLALKKAIKFIHHSCVMISTDNTTVLLYQQTKWNTFFQPIHRGVGDTSLVPGTRCSDQSSSYSTQIQHFGRPPLAVGQTYRNGMGFGSIDCKFHIPNA